MSRYDWIQNEALSKISDKVYADTHRKKDSSKQPDQYTLNIHNDEELYIIFYALNDLTGYMKGKVMPGMHTERTKEQMMNKAHDLANELFAYGYIDAFDQVMEAKSSISKGVIGTAKQYATSFGRLIKKSLLGVGTSQNRARQIQRFVVDATMAIEGNPERYVTDLNEFSKAFTFNTGEDDAQYKNIVTEYK